ncbi:MAG: DDE-type integrase/transposase/recombinase [Candidatus Woesearchaeota archaeon]
MAIIQGKLMNENPLVKCIFCQGKQVVKKGFRTTENRGRIQRYICRSCQRSFCNDGGFWRMRNSEAKITAGIDLYFSNLSSRKVRNHFRRHWQHNASHVSILDWCRRYTLKIQKYVNTLNPALGEKFYADETIIDRKGKEDWFWCNVDWETRFISGFHYSTDRGLDEAIEFLDKATSKKLPNYIQTDGALFYPSAMKKLFSNWRYRGKKVEHRINNVQVTGKHNVRIETVFSKIKDRVNDFRGLKALWSAPILMAGIVIQHNYIEAHTTTGKIPAELAGLKLETGQNRWLGLIKLTTF